MLCKGAVSLADQHHESAHGFFAVALSSYFPRTTYSLLFQLFWSFTGSFIRELPACPPPSLQVLRTWFLCSVLGTLSALSPCRDMYLALDTRQSNIHTCQMGIQSDRRRWRERVPDHRQS